MWELGHWRTRGYLPHLDETSVEQLITYRLADALPAHAVAKLADQALTDAQRCSLYERYLDAGHGSCALANPAHARHVLATWKRGDPAQYRLIAWVVMPNHVHVLVKLAAGTSLGKVVQAWKSLSA